MTSHRVALRFCPVRVLALMAFTAWPLSAHEEWNGYHIVYSAKSSYTYPFDGRSPKIAVALLNHHPTAAPATNFTFTVNGQRMDGDAFSTFPNGGSIVAGPDDFGIASALTAGVYDGRAGPPPAVGESKEYTFQFVFALAPGAQPPPGSHVSTNPDPANNNDISGTTTAKVSFINSGDNPVLTGPLVIGGMVRLASVPAGPLPLRVEVSTPFSNWFAVPTSPGGANSSVVFSQALPARDDWHVRFSADGHETRVIPVGFIND